MSEHEQMVERHIEFSVGPMGRMDERETERPICRYCWHEGPDGQPRRADWPCEVSRLRVENSRLREAVALLNSMVLSGESHSATSRDVVRRAVGTPFVESPPAASPAGGDGEGAR